MCFCVIFKSLKCYLGGFKKLLKLSCDGVYHFIRCMFGHAHGAFPLNYFNLGGWFVLSPRNVDFIVDIIKD